MLINDDSPRITLVTNHKILNASHGNATQRKRSSFPGQSVEMEAFQFRPSSLSFKSDVEITRRRIPCWQGPS